MQHNHVLNKLNFDLLTPSPRSGGRRSADKIFATVATAFFFTVLPFFVRFCRVYVMFVSNALRDVSETKMAFQTLATFTDIVQSNHRPRNATVLRL